MGDTSYEFSDNALCRRYFAKLDQIFGHLRNIAHNGAPASEAAELGKIEAEMIEAYLVRLTNSFAALSLKHLLTGLVRHALPHKL